MRPDLAVFPGRYSNYWKNSAALLSADAPARDERLLAASTLTIHPDDREPLASMIQICEKRIYLSAVPLAAMISGMTLHLP